MFVGLHAVLATSTGTPEVEISEDEGKQFMAAAQNVMRHYSVQSTQKTLDWVAFIGMTSAIYLPRVAGYSIRKKNEAVPAAPAATVNANGFANLGGLSLNA